MAKKSKQLTRYKVHKESHTTIGRAISLKLKKSEKTFRLQALTCEGTSMAHHITIGEINEGFSSALKEALNNGN